MSLWLNSTANTKCLASNRLSRAHFSIHIQSFALTSGLDLINSETHNLKTITQVVDHTSHEHETTPSSYTRNPTESFDSFPFLYFPLLIRENNRVSFSISQFLIFSITICFARSPLLQLHPVLFDTIQKFCTHYFVTFFFFFNNNNRQKMKQKKKKQTNEIFI